MVVSLQAADKPHQHGKHEHAHIHFSIQSVASGNWSNPKTWKPARLPKQGDRVRISRGTKVVFDAKKTPVLRLVQVVGTLSFARDRSTELNVALLKVQNSDTCSESGFACDFAGVNFSGEPHAKPQGPLPALEIGTREHPIPAGHTARVRLHYLKGMNKDDAPAIACCSARMEIHGSPLSHSWVKLGQDVKAGDQTVTINEDVTGWRVGDEVIVTGSKRVDRHYRTFRNRPDAVSTESRKIEKIDGRTITLDKPLKHEHFGSGEFRSEVANLSRNVVIESADPKGVRGHTVYHRFSQGGISYARFAHLGKENVLGRYSIHFHLVGDTMRGAGVIGAAIVDSHNRWVTIHGTQYLVVRDCVGYQSVGHGFFLEDGTEVSNLLDRNLAVQAYRGKRLPKQVLPFDPNDGAGFWWANGRNSFVRNVACENDEYGFRYDSQKRSNFDSNLPILMPDGKERTVDIRTIPVTRFSQNESHTEGLYAMVFAGTDGVGPDTRHPHRLSDLKIWQTHYGLRAQLPTMMVENLKIHKAHYGIYRPWFENHVYRDLSIAETYTEPFNRGLDDRSLQHGKITVDGLTFSGYHYGRSMPLIQISADNASGDAESHFRRVRVINSEGKRRWKLVNLGGGPRRTPKTPKGVPIYIHDYFGSGKHAKVVSTRAKDLLNDGDKYKPHPPLTGDEAVAAEVTNVKFPTLLHPVDDLPPATIITTVRRARSGGLTVTGITHDNGEITTVVVNGESATLTRTAPGVVDWTITLPSPGVKSIKAFAKDAAGNVEQRPHVQNVCEHLPLLAARSDRYALVRSIGTNSNGHGLACHMLLTGRLDLPAGFSQRVVPTPNEWPTLASLVKYSLRSGGDLPDAVILPQPSINEIGRVRPGQYAGKLGSKWEAWHINIAAKCALGNGACPNCFRFDDDTFDHGSDTIFDTPLTTLPDGGRGRLSARVNLLDSIEKQRFDLNKASDVRKLGQHRRQALSVLTHAKTSAAFDVENADPKLLARYGKNKFGLSLLMAKRLAEAGRSQDCRDPRQNVVVFAVVRMPADPDGKIIVVAEDLLHVVERNRPEFFADQGAHAVESGERIFQTLSVIRFTRVWSAKVVIAVRKKPGTIIFNELRAVAVQFNIENRAFAVAENIVAVRTDRHVAHQLHDVGDAALLEDQPLQRAEHQWPIPADARRGEDKMRRVTLKGWVARSCAVLVAGLATAASTSANANDFQDSEFPKPLTMNTESSAANRSQPQQAGVRQVGYLSSTMSSMTSMLDDGAPGEDPFSTPTINDMLGEDSPIKVGGWMQWGYHSKNNGLFNNHKDNVNLHQLWFYTEKVADGSKGLDFGFRFDAMYGVDAADTQAFGNRPGSWDFMNNFDHGIYGFALPQLYGEVACGDLSVKIGHFFTIVGYEVVTAPDNFFYSHAYTMYNSEPFTHTGALATYKASDDVTLYGGWTAGWDTGFDRVDDGSNFLGGASLALTDDITFTYVTTIGDFGARGEGYSHSAVADFKLDENWNYVLQSDLVNTNNGADHQYGVNQYLFYTYNEKIRFGSRFEWWKNAGNSQFASTSGVNIKPWNNFILRPEVRYDWNPGTGVDFTTFGIDAILTY
eukprot:g26521.t1